MNIHAQAEAGSVAQGATAFDGCYHCGLSLPPAAHWPVEIDGQRREMCCPGCQAAAQTIVEMGLADYYRTRSAFSATADGAALIPPELLLYDLPDAQKKFDLNEESAEATLSIEGIRCAACVWLIERRLARLPGLQAVNLNVATERLYVRWQKELCKPSDVLQAVRDIGYAAYPYDASRHDAQLRRASRTLSRQLFVAGLSMMQVMMYAVPAYISHDGTLESDMDALMRWASLLLTLPAVCYSALPFFRGAYASLRQGALGMDVPVALGIGAAFIGSVVAVLRGDGDVYFDSVTMFIFLLLCSRYLELIARRKAAGALEKLQHALPAAAARMNGYPAQRECSMVAATQLCAGDFILVKPGEAIAADGEIVEGASAIDMSLLTGESAALKRGVGDTLPGGAINITQAIVLRVSKVAADSTLSQLIRLIERAGNAKPQIALWADRVAAWFVAALLLFALAVFVFWQWHDPARAWPIAIAVLVVSCPCALSLATPTALAAATDRLVRQGVLIVQPHVLEILHRTTHIVFDKTGTLTVGKPTLQNMHMFADAERNACLQIAAALEASNAHPLAQAIVVAASAAAMTATAPVAHDVSYTAGQGLEGVIDGVRFRLGNAVFVGELAGHSIDQQDGTGMTSVYLGSSGTWLARFDLSDAMRDDARAVVAYFRKLGKTVILLSGDQPDVAQHVAAELGIAEAHGACLPEQKLAFVQKLQQQGSIVAMVGDGINDAAVLRAADVSFAMGSGAALAQTHADTVLLSPHLAAIANASEVAVKTMRVIRQNLVWATCYNLLAIPAAAIGWINPWLSGVGMSLSSAVVVLNALRLRRIPRRHGEHPGRAKAEQENAGQENAMAAAVKQGIN
ncbi:Cation transporting P-type ATPase, probable copper-exporting copA-like [Herminiimonas arsenicoxydans]|uniref:Cation transporting P-type ATPase, probable copper-exporting copA-like n=1 Tax=Herminiimonas arsenicoxydans TaxID=204773 RepID=A4G5L8_HERAR|nr:Cation transporting P-type ATPase, probable copper-exporting copA-like [Herminiimonas arsenicoxydans]